MWFKNLLVYRIKADTGLQAETVEEQLKRMLCSPAAVFEMESRGWVAPRTEDRFLHSLERHG